MTKLGCKKRSCGGLHTEHHGWRRSKSVLNMMNMMRMITCLMRSVVTRSLTHYLTFVLFFSRSLNIGSQLDCVKPDDPLSLNLKRNSGRQAGSPLLTPASHLPQIWQKSTKKQQKEKARNISNTGIVSGLVYLDIYVYICTSQNVEKLGCWCEVCTSVSSKEPILYLGSKPWLSRAVLMVHNHGF